MYIQYNFFVFVNYFIHLLYANSIDNNRSLVIIYRRKTCTTTSSSAAKHLQIDAQAVALSIDWLSPCFWVLRIFKRVRSHRCAVHWGPSEKWFCVSERIQLKKNKTSFRLKSNGQRLYWEKWTFFIFTRWKRSTGANAIKTQLFRKRPKYYNFEWSNALALDLSTSFCLFENNFYFTGLTLSTNFFDVVTTNFDTCIRR